MTEQSHPPNISHRSRFCTLEYSGPGRGAERVVPRTAPIIALILSDQDHSVSLMVDPERHLYVKREDSEYIELLIEDLAERAKVDSLAFFEQLSSLNLGPVVTGEVGTNIAESQFILGLLSRFVNIYTFKTHN